MKLLSLFLIDGIAFVKLFLVFVFTLAGFSMLNLLESFKIKRTVAFIGGLIYITTPLFFNYTIMGWTYVLLFMALLPLGVLYFTKANENRDWRYLILVAFIFELMLLQSQAIVWFPLVILALALYLIKDKQTFFTYVKSASIVALVTILLNFWWLITTFLVKSPVIFSGDILMSSESLGASVMLTPLNIMRLYGSLLNSQYEFIIQHAGLTVLSFIFPILFGISFLISENKRLRLTFFSLSLIPVLFYFLNFRRDLLTSLPLVNIIRDFGRFSVLSTFAIVIIVALVLNFLYQNTIKNGRTYFYLIIGLLFIYTFPWYGNYLTKYQPNLAEAQRIRDKVFSQEYNDVKTNLNQQKLDSKGLFLPAVAIAEFSDDSRFQGDFQGFYDNFFAFFKFHGLYPSNSRSSGYGDLLAKKLLDLKKVDSYKNFVKLTDTSDIIVRLNMVFDHKNELMTALNEDQDYLKTYTSDKVIVYKRKATSFLPHFYVPTQVPVTDKSVSALSELLSSPNFKVRSAFVFRGQNKEQEGALNLLAKSVANPPIIEYKKINPTKYRLVIHGATEPFPLVFSESFHDGWKLYSIKHQPQADGEITARLSDYQVFSGNQTDQSTKAELSEFIGKGLISSLGSGNQSVGFVSKNFQGTIQNDNLETGPLAETWFANQDAGQAHLLPDTNHIIINGYANGWAVKPSDICQSDNFCTKNSDGSYDLELVAEFWPQRLFYLGLAVSGATVLGLLVLFIAYKKKKYVGKTN